MPYRWVSLLTYFGALNQNSASNIFWPLGRARCMPNIFLILIKLKEEIGFEVLPLLGLYGSFGAQNKKKSTKFHPRYAQDICQVTAQSNEIWNFTHFRVQNFQILFGALNRNSASNTFWPLGGARYMPNIFLILLKLKEIGFWIVAPFWGSTAHSGP